MKLKYVGDNIVLLHGISKDIVMEELKSEEDGLLSIFHFVYEWNKESILVTGCHELNVTGSLYKPRVKNAL